MRAYTPHRQIGRDALQIVVQTHFEPCGGWIPVLLGHASYFDHYSDYDFDYDFDREAL
jgi:hypothetical protein